MLDKRFFPRHHSDVSLSIHFYSDLCPIHDYFSSCFNLWAKMGEHRKTPCTPASRTDLSHICPGRARNVYTKHRGEMIDLLRAGTKSALLKLGYGATSVQVLFIELTVEKGTSRQ